MKFIIKSVSAIVSFFLMVFPCLQSFINDIEVDFTIETAEVGAEMENLMQSINVWEMGNAFIGAENSEEHDIFEFVKYVQLMQCSGGNAQRDLFRDPYNTDVLDDYDFTRLLDNCAGILRLGAKPHLKLGNVPMKYTQNYEIGGFEVNVYPPDDYNVYYNYIAALAQALVDRFGKEEVLSWRFGVMTEYENADWFKTKGEDPLATATEFCKLYDYTVQALIDVIGEDVCVGAHSMTVTEGLWDERIFIDHLVDGTNYATGEKGSRVNFLTASFYDSTPGQFTEGFTLPETVALLKEHAESKGLTDLFYGVDEGRILSGNKSGSDNDQLLNRTTGYTWQGAYDARLWMQGVDSGLSYFSSWNFLSNGLFNGNPTVSYHVAKLFSGFEGMQRIRVDGEKKMRLPIGSEAKAMAAVDPENGNVRVMAYSFRNDVEATGTVNMNFNINLPDGEYKIVRYYIDDNCNYFDEWLVDREKYNITDDCSTWSPEDPMLDNPLTLSAQWARDIYFNELKAGYAEKARLVPVEETVTVTGGCLALAESLPLNTVVFIDIVK